MKLAVGGIVLTRYGRGVIRALSHTTSCVTSVDVQLIDDAGKVIGWCVIGVHEIQKGQQWSALIAYGQ